MKKLLISKKDGRIKAICDGSVEYDKKLFDLKALNIDEEKTKQGYAVYYKKGKLEYKEPEEIKKKQTTEKLKKELEEADDIDKIKQVINKII